MPKIPTPTPLEFLRRGMLVPEKVLARARKWLPRQHSALRSRLFWNANGAVYTLPENLERILRSINRAVRANRDTR